MFSAQSLARRCGVSAPADLMSDLPREPNELGRIWLVHTGVVCASSESCRDASLLVDDKSMGLSTIGSSASRGEAAGCCCGRSIGERRTGVSASRMALGSRPSARRRGLKLGVERGGVVGVERGEPLFVRQRLIMLPTFEGRLRRETPCGAARATGGAEDTDGVFHRSCSTEAGGACAHERNFSRACSSPRRRVPAPRHVAARRAARRPRRCEQHQRARAHPRQCRAPAAAHVSVVCARPTGSAPPGRRAPITRQRCARCRGRVTVAPWTRPADRRPRRCS